MEKVAVFGNAGGGKSTLSKRLSELTGLPLYSLDQVKDQAGNDEKYQQVHQQLLVTQQWIMDGFGSMETLWPRLDVADSLIFVDLPLYRHFWWVTKRMLTGYFKPPEGWPEKSPIFKYSMSSYSVLLACHKYLNPKYREYIEKAKGVKQVYHLRSVEEILQFLEFIEKETSHKIINRRQDADSRTSP